MQSIAKFYNFYKSSKIKAFRFIFALLLIWALSTDFINNPFLSFNFKVYLLFFSFFVMFEIFFYFKISKVKPVLTVLTNNSNPYDSFTLKALSVFESCPKTSFLIKKLLEKEEIKFMLLKADFNKKEIPLLEISKEDLAKLSFETVKKISGNYVTTMDIFASYIFGVEQETKLLFNKKLKEQEFLNILQWARFDFQDQEKSFPFRVKFWGKGIGEDWVSGWTLETKKYTQDLTPLVLKEKPTMVGRHNEYKALIEILYKNEKNSAILIGEPGSGKTTLIESLAFDSFVGDLPGSLYHKRILEVLTGALLAGTANQGDLEKRLEEIMQEILHSGDIIIYIPELQNIFGSSSFHKDLSGILLPYLKKGKIRLIGSITPGNFKAYIEPNHSLLDVFEVVKLNEPDKNLSLEMLLEKANVIEKKNKISLTYRSVSAACTLGKRYIQDKAMPGSGVILLDDVANSCFLQGKKIVEEEDIVQKIEEKTKIAVSKPQGHEKELLLHFEEKLHERIIDQNEAVVAISEALRRLRAGITSSDKPISFLFMGPTGVGKTETAKALSSLYFGGEEKMIRLDMSEYTGDEGIKRLLGAPPGEGQEKGELTEKVYENPFSLVLLDEFEKANPYILDLFLQVLDDGRLTDNKGKTVSFLNTIIIATSNAGSEFIREEINKGTKIDKNFQNKLLDLLQSKGIFKPELLNRFDGVIVFKPLSPDDVREVSKLMLAKVYKKLLDQDISVLFDEKLLSKISKEGFDEQFGARPLRRFIQDNIEDFLAKKILNDEIKRGDKVVLSVDEKGSIIY